MKKFELHLDALVVIALVFVALLAGNWYQNQKYDQLFIEKIDLEWRLQNAETNLKSLLSKAGECSAKE